MKKPPVNDYGHNIFEPLQKVQIAEEGYKSLAESLFEKVIRIVEAL